MEPVGAASSIITVIQVTARVVAICYDYQSGIRHYPKDIVKITHELQSLRNVLERLADLAQSQGDLTSVALPTLDSLNDSGSPLEICVRELRQLEVKLTPAKGRFKEIGQAIVWPLMEKDVQKTLTLLARQRGVFQLALTADHTTMTLAIKTATTRTEGNLKALTQCFQSKALDERNEQILQWLAAPDPSSNHNKAYQTKQRETGRWFINSANYINWRTQQSSFLWLHGIPGCGKTVLCSTAIEDIASRCQVGGRKILGGRKALAYYYFDFNEGKKQTFEGLLRSLVTQLFSQTGGGSEAMEALFSDCGEGQREPTPKSLIQALRQLSEPLEEIHLIFDALDECVEIPAVISFLAETRGWHNYNLHILITSRNEVAIEKGLRSLTTDQIQVQNFLVDADIRLLVRECLRSDPELSRWSESIKVEIEKTLYEGSKGMFRWAVCQLETLRRCIKPSALRKALASLPKTLDETYERILCSIDQDHAEDALKVLQWLAFSARPLGTQEVAEATAITMSDSPVFDQEDRLRDHTDILAICSSLITVSSRPINLPFEQSSTGNPPKQWRSSDFKPSTQLPSYPLLPRTRSPVPDSNSPTRLPSPLRSQLHSLSSTFKSSTQSSSSELKYPIQLPSSHEMSQISSELKFPISPPVSGLMTKPKDACLSNGWVEKENSVSLDDTLKSSPANPVSMDDDEFSLESRPETDPSDEDNRTPPADLTEDHPRHYEVRLAHDSVKEYLVSERIKGTNAAFYSISESSSNVFLARSCLAYLMHFKEPLNESTALYLAEYPLLRYSAQQWEYHVIRSRDLDQGHRMGHVLKDFFLSKDSSFSNWLEGPFAPYFGNFQQIEERVDDGEGLKMELRLYHASRLGLLDVCKFLLEQGVKADPPIKSTTGLVRSLSTPLQIAAHKGNEGVVRLLLDHGANVNQRSVHASTLDYAVEEGHESIVRLLLERGAKVTIEAANPYYGLRGLSTLVLAARVGHAGITKLVIDNGVFPKPRDSYSEAYQEAIAQGHQNVADLLLEHGADPNYLTSNNDTDDSDVEYFDVGV